MADMSLPIPHCAELACLPRVLDVGGWFKPLTVATHVVDLLPYETRYGRLNLSPLPGERFSRTTWTQCDFLRPELRLPFVDGYFDYVHCGHTIEDLADPVPLLRELPRVARAGLIRCPSRLSEQTRGARDRMSSVPGHPHHHWVVDVDAGRLRLCAKSDSCLRRRQLLPLTHLERICQVDPHAAEIAFHWEAVLPFVLLRGPEAAAIAERYAGVQAVSTVEVVRDATVRALRRMKYWRRPSGSRVTSDWWQEILALSRPYSTIPLPP